MPYGAGPLCDGGMRRRCVNRACGAATARRHHAPPPEGHPRRHTGLDARSGRLCVAAACAASTTLAGQHLRCSAWPRAAATLSPMRAPLGGSPCGEGHDRCGPLARVIVATAGVSLRRSRTPRLLALQLLEFAVDRAQTPLTGHVRPSAHHEGAPPAGGPPFATGRLLQVSEPSMDGVRHGGVMSQILLRRS